MEQPEHYKGFFVYAVLNNGIKVIEPLLGYTKTGILVDFADRPMEIPFANMNAFAIGEPKPSGATQTTH